MALSIIPKSEVRKVTTLTLGFAEIPLAEVDGKQGWALPGGQVVFTEEEVFHIAKKIDSVIRSNILADPDAAKRLKN